MAMDSGSITTESYMNFMRCIKAGYLSRHHAGQKSENTLTNIDIINFQKICHSLILQEEKQDGVEIIFKNVFRNEDVIICPDVIIKDSNRCVLVKLKYSTFYSNKSDYDELAFTAHILKTQNILITEFWILSINGKYLHKDLLDKTFLNDVRCNANIIIKKMRSVAGNIKLLKDTLSETEIPFEPLSDKCKKCTFLDICNPYRKSTLNLTEMKWRKKLSLSWKNFIDLSNIPDDVNFTRAQWREIELLKSKITHVEKDNIKNYLKDIKLNRDLLYLNMTGLHTYMPVYEGSKPFDILFFQYSLIYKRESNQKGTRLYEKLNTKPLNVREVRKFFDNFLFDVNLSIVIPIIVFDKKRAEEMLDSILYLMPEKKDEIKAIKGRLFGLQEIFSNKWYLNPNLNGSTLMEDILPDMSSELDWNALTKTNFNTLRKEIVFSEKFSESNKIVLKKLSSLFAHGLISTAVSLKKSVGFKV